MHERRVIYLVDVYPKLSETFVRLEVRELRRKGWAVDIVALRRGDMPDDGLTRYLDELRAGRWQIVRDHGAAARHTPMSYLRFLLLVARLGDERKRCGWRLVPSMARWLRGHEGPQLHSHFAWSASAAALLLRCLTGGRWSMTVHARDIFADRRNLSLKLASVDALVTVCHYNERWLREHEGVTTQIHQVVCGVEVPVLAPARPTAGTVVAVGRLVEKKGFDVALKALEILVARGVRVRLELVGDGPLDNDLRALACELGLGAEVAFCGAVQHDDVMEKVAAAQVLCLPARIASDGDRDSMPVVVKEAMARGVPVIATNLVGIPEMVDEEVGWLVPSEDAEALAAALQAALEDPAECARRGQQGRRRVTERFQIADEVDKLIAVFEGAP